MGWLFSSEWADRNALVQHLRRSERFGDGVKLLRATTVGTNHWYLAQHVASGEVFVGLDLTSVQGGQGGYKDLDESVGPVEVDCPLAYIDAPGAKPSGYAVEWRQRVREHHARRLAAPKPETGMAIEVGGVSYRLHSSAGARQGWFVTRSDGEMLRIGARDLAKVLQR